MMTLENFQGIEWLKANMDIHLGREWLKRIHVRHLGAFEAILHGSDAANRCFNVLLGSQFLDLIKNPFFVQGSESCLFWRFLGPLWDDFVAIR